jgi:hypothetical protein
MGGPASIGAKPKRAGAFHCIDQAAPRCIPAERYAVALRVGKSAGVHDRHRCMRVAPEARASLDDRERQNRSE